MDELNAYDIVVASRYKDIVNPVRRVRRLWSRIYHLVCKILFDISVEDIGSGTVGFRKTSLQKLNLERRGFGVHAELFVKAGRQGLTIREVPAIYDKGEKEVFPSQITELKRSSKH